MVKIRLKRVGTKNRAQWRIVVADSKMPRDGRFIESIGFYDPLPIKEKIEVNRARLEYWLGRGAQPSQTLKSLFKRIEIKVTKTAG
jgi:small subunit ribosomal protein S16